MIQLDGSIYTDGAKRYPRLSSILDLIFYKPNYPEGAAKRGTGVHAHCAALLKPGHGKEYDWSSAGDARTYLENYARFLSDYGIDKIAKKHIFVETPVLGKVSGRTHGFDRDFYYGCTPDVLVKEPRKKPVLIEIKTGTPGPESRLQEISRDIVQVLAQANAIGRLCAYPQTDIVYISSDRYRLMAVDIIKFRDILRLFVPALICWYSRYGD